MTLQEESLQLVRLPKAQRELAYRWELDREHLRDFFVIPSWASLNNKQRAAVRLVCSKERLWGEEHKPSAELLSGVGQLEKLMLHEMAHKDIALSSTLVPLMRTNREFHEEAGKPIAGYTEEALLARLAYDKDGWGLLAFRYDPQRPLDDILADLRKDLEDLRTFPSKPMRPRGKDWSSRMVDLICLRAKRANLGDWKIMAPIINPCIKAAGCGGPLSQKSWLNRISRAQDELRERDNWLIAKQQAKLPYTPPEHHEIVMRRPFESETVPWVSAPKIWGTAGFYKFSLKSKR